MKALIKTLVVLVVLVIALCPLGIGFGLEYGVALVARPLTDRSLLGLSDVNFERGYLSSRVRIKFKPILAGEPQPLVLDMQFQHGLVLFGQKVQLGLLGVAAQLKSDVATAQLVVAQDEPFYRLIGKIESLSRGQFTDSYTAASLKMNQGRLQWSNGRGEGRLDLSARRMQYEGHLSQLSWQSPHAVFNFAAPDISKEVTLTPSGLNWFARLAFKGLNMQWDAESFWLKNGALGVSRTPQNSLERLQLSVVAEEFKSKSLQLKALDANLALDQLPLALSSGLFELGLGSLDDVAFEQQVYDLARQHLQSSQATLLVERFGALHGDKSFWLLGRTDLPPLAALPLERWQDPQSLLAAVVATGEVHMEKALLGDGVQAIFAAQNGNGAGQVVPPVQVDLFAKAFVAQGMLTDDGAMYSCKVVFNRGEITLNDKPMALPF